MNCLSFMLAFTMHLGLDSDYNNIHPHIRCEKDNLISGVYYNSEDNISSYIGLQHKGFEIGLVSGYTYNNIVPMIRYKKNNWFITPSIEKNGKKGFVLGLEF